MTTRKNSQVIPINRETGRTVTVVLMGRGGELARKSRPIFEGTDEDQQVNDAVRSLVACSTLADGDTITVSVE